MPTIHIDARGAQKGVEQDLMQTFNEMEERILNNAVNVIVDGARGGSLSGVFR